MSSTDWTDQPLHEAECPSGGWLKEVAKQQGRGQIVIRAIPPGAVVGRHKHPLTGKVWWFPVGKVRIKLEYADGKRRIVEPKPTDTVEVPAGTGHLVENIGKEWAVMVYVADRVWDGGDKEAWEPW